MRGGEGGIFKLAARCLAFQAGGVHASVYPRDCRVCAKRTLSLSRGMTAVKQREGGRQNTTNDVGNATQGPGAPDHHEWCAAFRGLLPFWGKVMVDRVGEDLIKVS